MFKYCCLLLCALVVAATLPGSAEASKEFNEAAKVLQSADTVELISLDPAAKGFDKKQSFHGWKVLGRTSLKDKVTRERVIAAIKKGVADSDGSVAGCFRPRHGIRATRGKTTVELVICFEC